MSSIRVLIVDDHALFIEGLQALLETTPDIRVLGRAADGEQALQQVTALQPDVVLMDLNMPGMDGVSATRRILAQQPGLGVVVITMLEDDASVFAAMRAGARGYVLKGSDYREMLQSIRAVAAGQALFGAAIASRIGHFFQQLGQLGPGGDDEAVFPELTAREREVLGLIAQGQTNAEIANRLVISPHTVRNHITSIFSKLQVADRAQAIVRARRAGLGDDPPRI